MVKPAILAATVATAAAGVPSFSEFVVTHGKKYSSREELLLRRNIFAANVAKINAHNSQGKSWTLAVNEFADLTPQEFKSRMTGGYRAADLKRETKTPEVQGLPASVDWTTPTAKLPQGAVTGVKNQGQCGSCWSFSTTGSIEGAHAIATGNLVSLSEQQLMDCSTSYGNNGCNGGLMDYAFAFVIANKGICTEESYPYQAVQGTCQTNCTVGATIASYTNVTPNSEEALMAAVAQQPVSIAIEADQMTFQFYGGGVMTGTCGDALDHGVLVVGYGEADNTSFWKVKNSWGESWGMEGYILLGRGMNVNNGTGQCGILSVPSYPVV